MKRIIIEVIPHSEQRYDTVGDWQLQPLHECADYGKYTQPLLISNEWLIQVSETGAWRTNLLLALHELVEMALCIDGGVTAEEVDKFDMNWKPHSGIAEPGDDPDAPYTDQHANAQLIEGRVCRMLGIAWDDYEKVVNNLGPGGPPKLTREQKLEAFVDRLRTRHLGKIYVSVDLLEEYFKLLD